MILDSNQLKLAASLIHTIATHKLPNKSAQALWHWLQPGYFFVPAHCRPKLTHISEHYYLPHPPTTHYQWVRVVSSWDVISDLCTEQVQEYLWTNEFKISPTLEANSCQSLQLKFTNSTPELSAIQKMLKNFLATHGPSMKTEE